ncbi:hypothetical protein [Streptomyces sp. NBC_00316]|uniref:hypothetical protein n=1 Tax=Streptomyces sp. NBC_00316 TaxID=2975710 RepID=UPI002E2AB75C|nr:hypothetical protein [Streptomyces sp. NBC_00316]
MALLASVTPALASSALYCGGGYGPTAEIAVRSAIDDARNSASGEGLFRCELVGEPFVAEIFDDPYRGHFFSAGVNMACE